MTTSPSGHRSSGSASRLLSAQSGWPGHSVLPISVFLSLKLVYCLPSWYSTNGAVRRAASIRFSSMSRRSPGSAAASHWRQSATDSASRARSRPSSAW